jgi:hypothetical protein
MPGFTVHGRCRPAVSAVQSHVPLVGTHCESPPPTSEHVYPVGHVVPYGEPVSQSREHALPPPESGSHVLPGTRHSESAVHG